MLPIINKILRKDKERNGKAPVVLQVYYQKERKQIFTGLSIEPNFWDMERSEASKKYHNYVYFNQLLKNKYQEVEASYTKQLLNGGNVSIKHTLKVSRINFFDYAKTIFENKANKVKADHIVRCMTIINDFKGFTGHVTFQAITPQILKNYENYLFEKGNQRNTVNKAFKRIKHVFDAAIEEKLTDQNPFKLFKLVSPLQTKRAFLTIDEINLIANADVPEDLMLVRDYFLLSCYTGMRFSDLEKFDKDVSIERNNGVDRIIIGTTKTGSVVSLKLSETVKALISRIDRPIYTNVHSNRLLKILCAKAGIKKKVSWHISRHSAAVNMASAKVPIEAVSKLLGHADIKTTAIYYKIIDPILDDYMDTFNEFYTK